MSSTSAQHESWRDQIERKLRGNSSPFLVSGNKMDRRASLDDVEGKMGFDADTTRFAHRRTSSPMSVENLLRYYERRNFFLKRNENIGGSFSALPRSVPGKRDDDDILEYKSTFSGLTSKQIFPDVHKQFPVPISKKYNYYRDDRTASNNLIAKKSTPKIKEKPGSAVITTNSKLEIKIPVKSSSKASICGGNLVVTTLDELKNIDKSEAYYAVTAIVIYDVNFEQFVPFLSIINADCKKLQRLELHRTRVTSFEHLEQIVQLRTLEDLVIGPNGNPITRCSTWMLYLIRRMSHLALKTINNERITSEACATAQVIFGATVHLLRTKHDMEDVGGGDEDAQRTPFPLISSNQKVDPILENEANKFSNDVLRHSVDEHVKKKLFNYLWRDCFKRAVERRIKENECLTLEIFKNV